MRGLFLMICCVVCLLSPPVAEAQDRPNRITHGPILGRLGAHEIGIWARTERSGVFRVRYGLRQGHLDMMSGPVTTLVEHDNSVRSGQKVHVVGEVFLRSAMAVHEYQRRPAALDLNSEFDTIVTADPHECPFSPSATSALYRDTDQATRVFRRLPPLHR